MRKKITSLLIASLMILGIAAGCNGNSSSDVSEGSGNSSVDLPSYQEVKLSPDYAEVDTSGYTTYYVDGTSGSDANDGLSEASPKATLGWANQTISSVTSSTQILFKAGSVYEGTLQVNGYTATKEFPLLIGVYGQTEEAKYARITSNNYCIEINKGNVRVSGFECTAPKGRNGIFVNLTKAGATTDIVIKDNYIHDVNFVYSGTEEITDKELSASDVREICSDGNYTYGHGAIVLETNTSSFVGPSWCEDIWIENNVIERCSRVGMFLTSSWARRPGMDWGNNHYYDDDTNYYPHKRFVIRGNKLTATGGDGIVLLAARDSYIENNSCYYAQLLGRSGFYNAGIWTHSCKNTVIQYNEAAYTQRDNGAGDGEGFDIDIGNSDIIFRYNYAHDNEGGAMLLCNLSTEETTYDKDGNNVLDELGLPIIEKKFSEWDRVTISNNVFIDNGLSVGGRVISCAGKVDGIRFMNNTVVTSGASINGMPIASYDFNNSMEKGKDWLFYNNIFVSRAQAYNQFDMSFCESYEFKNNIFYGFNSQFYTFPVYTTFENYDYDPQIELNTAQNGLNGANAFIAQNDSVYQDGIALDTAFNRDYRGNSTENIRYIGAYSSKSKG